MKIKYLVLLSSFLGAGSFVSAADVQNSSPVVVVSEHTEQVLKLIRELEAEITVTDKAVTPESLLKIRQDLWGKICARLYGRTDGVNPLDTVTKAIFEENAFLDSLRESIDRALTECGITRLSLTINRSKDSPGENLLMADSRFLKFDSFDALISVYRGQKSPEPIHFKVEKGYLKTPVMTTDRQEKESTYGGKPTIQTEFLFYRAPWYSNRFTGGDYTYGFEYIFPKEAGVELKQINFM